MNKIRKYEKQYHELRYAKLAATGGFPMLTAIPKGPRPIPPPKAPTTRTF